MKINNFRVGRWFMLFTFLALFSCKKTFDLKPENQVDISQNYRNVNDANAVVTGIYGKLLGLAKQYVVLNELRADLMEVTNNADQYLREINVHNTTANNPYANPRPFYEIILNCNDALKNFDLMLQDKRMTSADYAQRYSDLIAVRSWLYLQLGIHFGTVPYVTDPLANVLDLQDQTKFPRLTFDQLIDKLITTMEAIPYKDVYSATINGTGNNASPITTVDAYNTQNFFINKYCLLGDLYLWKGNYTMAATNYRTVLESGTRLGSASNLYFNQYKIPFASVADNNDLSVGYLRYREQDINSLINNNNQGWRSIFARTQDALFNSEWIWIMYFDQNFAPVNPFIDLFSNQGGSYLLKPSQVALDAWNGQAQSNGFPYDQRGRFTVQNLNGQPVIMKYLYNYLDPATQLPTNILQKNGRWFLYRGATLNLRFAEAANRDNYTKLAYAFVNVGIRTVYNGLYPTAVTTATSTVPSNLPTDVTDIMQTKLPAPYDFDARTGEAPRYRSPWLQQVGTRTRANLNPLDVSLIDPVNLMSVANQLRMENEIVNEAGLELAYEGNRWPDLMRIARRRNDPAFLAEKVYQKLVKDGIPEAAAVRSKLMNINGWYLPFKMQ
ncbi:MAG: RagB/SusD family nutrient uptake outer membrane protein [Sphingobacteriaceae bacterium]|nr:MAG: RagB/SusD family nutrient uptake outer membrane protein [Sphingobacteriaceae bacterium]